jgi:plastocyanin/cytoskeletal protein RodZ
MRFGSGRAALGKAVYGVVALVIVVLTGVAFYLTPGLMFQANVQPGTTNRTSSISQASTETTPPRSTSTQSTTTSVTSSSNAQAPEFLISTSPETVLMTSGDTRNYVTLSIVPLPSVASAGETVTLTSSAPNGVSVKLSTDRVKISSTSKGQVPLTIAVSPTAAPGNYTIAVQGKSGAFTGNSTFTVRVVRYLVYLIVNAFIPGNITVPPGSTVFWMSIDIPPPVYPSGHTVTFTTGTSARSSTLQLYDWYSYTFTAAGSYSYHCEFHAGMKGVVSVSGN